jgi:hypothetical protein
MQVVGKVGRGVGRAGDMKAAGKRAQSDVDYCLLS